jgi:Uncharacterized conserved protein
MKGSYTLLIELSETTKIEVGSLGDIEFKSGFYVYNGSAFGPGGLKRVERHREKCEEGGSCHWHIDYLLALEQSEIVDVFVEEGSDHECSLSQELKSSLQSLKSFGCSDCGCGSHLFFSREREDLETCLSDFYS